MTRIFEAYDIRGVYPDQIDETTASKIGFAFARYLEKQRLVVGHDMRLSSPGLNEAFMRGVMATGAEITDIGLATTPMLYTAIIDGDFDGGAMITASHLPAEFNGFKLCREKAIPLSRADGLPEVEKLYRDADHPHCSKRGRRLTLDSLERYVTDVSAFVYPLRKLHVVVDAGNGMGGLDTPLLLRRFPEIDFTPMYMEADGTFPHHIPNPVVPETTRELQERVISEKADLGIAFDGDCDRCGFVDETGSRVPADLAIAVLAEYFLRKAPGATVLYDLRSSRAVPERIRQLGGVPIKTRVGHSFVKEKMRQVDAVFAGELSGHYYFREMGFIDSGVLAMITMLDLLGQKDVPLSHLIRPLKKYARTGEINLRIRDRPALLGELEQAYRDGHQEHIDGLTVEYKNWWFNLRPSNTEPVVRLVMEANDDATLMRQEPLLLDQIRKYELEAQEST